MLQNKDLVEPPGRPLSLPEVLGEGRTGREGGKESQSPEIS